MPSIVQTTCQAFAPTMNLRMRFTITLDVTKENPKPFVWIKTADQVLANIARYCQRTSRTGH